MATNPFDQFDQASNPFDQFDKQPAPAKKKNRSDLIDERIRAMQNAEVPESLRRQSMLAGRYMTETLALPDLLAQPIRSAVNYFRPGTFTQSSSEAIGDILNLPQPETDLERGVSYIARPVAGALGSAGGATALAPRVIPAARGTMEFLAANPRVQRQAAVGAGIGTGIATELDADPLTTLAAGVLGGIAAPATIKAGQMALEPVKDIAATIHASAGGKWGTERIMKDALERNLGSQKDAVRFAANSAREIVPGARPTVGEAVAEQNMRSGEQTGGWIIRLQKDLYGAKGVEDVLPTVYKSQDKAVMSAKNSLTNATNPMREKVLNSVNLKGGASVRQLLDDMDNLAADPEMLGNKATSQAIKIAKREINRILKESKSTDKMDAKALYEVRKTLNQTVERGLGIDKIPDPTTAARNKMAAGYAVRNVQTLIDKAIKESAPKSAQPIWDKYLKTFSEGMRKIDEQALRKEAMDEIAKGVKPTGGVAVATGETPKAPNLLNTKMAIVNWALRALGGNANQPVVQELSRRLADPKEFAKLLLRPDKDPTKKALMEIIKYGQEHGALAYSMSEEQ